MTLDLEKVIELGKEAKKVHEPLIFKWYSEISVFSYFVLTLAFIFWNVSIYAFSYACLVVIYMISYAVYKNRASNKRQKQLEE